MADPLSLLRQFATSGRQIREKDDLIVFGDQAYPRGVKTNFLVYNKKDEFYTLESLFFFFKKKDLAHTAYVKEAAAVNIQVVTRADRKSIQDFLTLKTLDKLPSSIDRSAPIPVPVQLSKEPEAAAPESKRPRLENSETLQKEKERLASILDATSRPTVSKAELIRDLSKEHGLTADKIAALRSKVFARKRTQIKSVEGEETAAGPRMEGEQLEAAKELFAKERQWRTRTNILEAASKNFAKTIFPILQTLKMREEGKTVEPQPPKEIPAVQKPQQPETYNRYDQERFRKEETEGFKIDTMGTYHGITLKSITEGAKPKPLAQQPQQKQTEQRPQKRTSRTPIIVIPAAMTSLITTFNAREMLQDLRFVSSEEKKAGGAKKESDLLIQRHKEGGAVPYRITDNPLKLNEEEWERVVAVFVQGPAWQFKGWPWGGNPVEIFTKVAAFHLKWEETKLDANVAKWAVHVLQLSRTKRHLDRASLLKFWETLDKHMTKSKAGLRF